ncbi:MAG: hypothetical protein GY867_08410 [bacterium]|nr:hypothetical protein [bacterium]
MPVGRPENPMESAAMPDEIANKQRGDPASRTAGLENRGREATTGAEVVPIWRPKVYIDTSVVSAYFDERMPERQKLTRSSGTLIGDFTMIELSDADRRQIWKEVAQEFPDDRTMQEVHYARYLRLRELADLPLRERLRNYLRTANEPVARAS